MNSKQACYVWALAGSALLCTIGCKLPSSSTERHKEKSASSTAPRNGGDFDLNLNCVIDSIQNPTESFHYSYKKDDPDNPVAQQADITPNTIDGTATNSGGTRTFKGVKSDRESWQSAWTNLMGISGMSSTIATVNHSSAMVRGSKGQINGYEAVQYSIDTSQGNAAELGLYKVTLGDGGFEKGTAWVNAKGCPVSLSLDSEMHLNNGTVSRQHYEIQMIKK